MRYHLPVTVALLEHLSGPDDIADVLCGVREEAKLAASGKQVPWDFGSVTGGVHGSCLRSKRLQVKIEIFDSLLSRACAHEFGLCPDL